MHNQKKRSRHIGKAGVLTYKHVNEGCLALGISCTRVLNNNKKNVNEGLKKLAQQGLERLNKQRVVDRKKRLAEDKK